MIKRFFELQEKVLSYYNKANTKLLKKAYSIAVHAHVKQKRATNEPYIIHPLSVAATLADLKLDEISIAAGLLHDVIEDSEYTREDLKKLFGSEISDIVWGVTKISKISNVDTEDAQAETLKKMIMAMSSDVRVILIKLADRYHNIQTLDALSEERQKRIAKETLDIYAPIANRLGMGKMKTKLENIAFRYAYPKQFLDITQKVSAKKKWAKLKLENLKQEIEDILKQYEMSGEIQYRIKREISIYRKLLHQNINLDMVYDLLALRIITTTVENCYTLMGEIHQRWTYIPSRWRDFIATQKSNGYQSIHTTIMTKEGVKFEIQIRTKSMHRVAENGIAAHWKYKEGISFLDNDQRLKWFRDMVDSHKSNPNPKDFLNLVKGDLIQNEIYVFTPKGKVINLKKGSTPIDFAYAIHSEVGDHCKGAIVNENFASLKTELSSGDVVEIVISRNSHPTIDWLKYVATTRARRKILNYIQKEESTYYQEKGKRIWERILREYKRKQKLELQENEVRGRISTTHNMDMDTFFRSIGSGHKTLDRKGLKKLFPEVSAQDISTERKVPRRIPQLYKLVNVDGYQDIDIAFAKCCNPIKGDKITGYVTKNRGLVIHKSTCSNLKNIISSRQTQVYWNLDVQDYSYLVRYDLIVSENPRLLTNISTIISNYDSTIKKIENEKINQQMNKIKVSFEVKDTKQLKKIYNDIKRKKEVISIIRKRA